MRIATWNLAGRWSSEAGAFLSSLEADVALLTEVPPDTGLDAVLSTGTMAPGQHYAAVVGTQLAPRQAPERSASAVWGDITFISSVLPWRTSRSDEHIGQAAQAKAQLTELHATWPAGTVVWGGDWNHELLGRMWAGSRVGREGIRRLLHTHQLKAVTEAEAAVYGDRSIDHVAVPVAWSTSVRQFPAVSGGSRLSDHDAYVVSVS